MQFLEFLCYDCQEMDHINFTLPGGDEIWSLHILDSLLGAFRPKRKAFETKMLHSQNEVWHGMGEKVFFTMKLWQGFIIPRILKIMKFLT